MARRQEVVARGDGESAVLGDGVCAHDRQIECSIEDGNEDRSRVRGTESAQELEVAIGVEGVGGALVVTLAQAGQEVVGEVEEPTAALGVKETGQVLNLIQQIKAKGLPVILISHNMPNVFEVADRIHIADSAGCAGVITPKSHAPTEAVAIMTGATTLQRG